MASESGKTRRRYGTQFKVMVLAQCEEPGASVAQVAMAHGINDNVVHRWRQLARQRQVASLVAGRWSLQLRPTVPLPPSSCRSRCERLPPLRLRPKSAWRFDAQL